MVDFDEDSSIQINVYNPRDQYEKKLQEKNKEKSSKVLKKKIVSKRKNVIIKPKVLIKPTILLPKLSEDVKTNETSVKLKKLASKVRKRIVNENLNEKTSSDISEEIFFPKKIEKKSLSKKKNDGKEATKKRPESGNAEKVKINFSKNIGKQGLKRKSNEKKEQTTKKFKASVIYNCDMETPHIQKVDVVPIRENVFSKENFSTLKLHEFMVDNLKRMGMEWMTEVQQRSIPAVMEGRDLLVKSQTGSGKTLTYGIPIVNMLQAREPRINRNDGPYCIVVVPTRELVMQTYNVINKLVKPFVWVVPGYLMGGEKRKSEKSRLKKGMNIIVSTPGRLVDHLQNTSSLQVHNITHLVVDEADRMFEMGFEKDISRVVQLVQQKCSSAFQTTLLSATLSPGVEKLAGMSLKEPLKIDIVNKPQQQQQDMTTDSSKLFSTPSNLKHHFVVVPTKLRLVTLATMLLWKCQLSVTPCKAIVFLSTQDAVEFHHSLLEMSLFSPDDDDDDDDIEGVANEEGEEEKEAQGSKKPCTKLFKLYGDLEQKERMKIFAAFHKATSGVLLCTDVAARGLDLPHIDWILQYNTPGSPTDYIHRVGRTARIGSHGNALIFLAPCETEYVKVLAEHRISMSEIKMNDILAKLLIEVQLGKIDLTHKGNVPRTVQDAASSLQTRLEGTLCNDMHLRSLARKAYQSFIRAYATYPASLKHIFHIKHLHLGHLASSFALSESPSDTSKVVSKFRKKESRERGGGGRGGRRGGERGGGRERVPRGGGPRRDNFKKKSTFHHAAVSEFI